MVSITTKIILTVTLWKLLVFALEQESEDIDAWKIQVWVGTSDNHRSFDVTVKIRIDYNQNIRGMNNVLKILVEMLGGT